MELSVALRGFTPQIVGATPVGSQFTVAYYNNITTQVAVKAIATVAYVIQFIRIPICLLANRIFRFFCDCAEQVTRSRRYGWPEHRYSFMDTGIRHLLDYSYFA